MRSHTRALIAASAHAFIIGKKVAGVHDHSTGRDLRLAAEAQGVHLQGFDGDRGVRFGGTLPEIYDAGDAAFVSLDIAGATARGYDRNSSSAYSATITDRLVQLYDHGENMWFTFAVQVI